MNEIFFLILLRLFDELIVEFNELYKSLLFRKETINKLINKIDPNKNFSFCLLYLQAEGNIHIWYKYTYVQLINNILNYKILFRKLFKTNNAKNKRIHACYKLRLHDNDTFFKYQNVFFVLINSATLRSIFTIITSI